MPTASARRPAEDVVRSLLGVAGGLAVRAGQDLDCDGAHQPVGDAAAESAEPVEASVGALGAVAEDGTEKPPERVAPEPDSDRREQDMTERVLLDRVQRTLLVRDLAAVPERPGRAPARR